MSACDPEDLLFVLHQMEEELREGDPEHVSLSGQGVVCCFCSVTCSLPVLPNNLA